MTRAAGRTCGWRGISARADGQPQLDLEHPADRRTHMFGRNVPGVQQTQQRFQAVLRPHVKSTGAWPSVATWVDPALERITSATIDFPLCMHEPRLAHARRLHVGGANLKSVMERIGHTQMTTTRKSLHSLANAGDKAPPPPSPPDKRGTRRPLAATPLFGRRVDFNPPRGLPATSLARRHAFQTR